MVFKLFSILIGDKTKFQTEADSSMISKFLYDMNCPKQLTKPKEINTFVTPIS